MNNYRCLKTKFKDIPIGTWFTYVNDKCKSYYFKIEGVITYHIGHSKNFTNAVIMEGPKAGILAVFDDDDEVYWGKI